MAISLNQAGYRRALALIGAGKVDRDSPWGFSAEDGDAILGEPPDWKAYASWHLGRREGAGEETKDAWAYPFGKGGRLYRSALTAIRQRSAQQGERDIFEAAGRLLEELDGRRQAGAFIEIMAGRVDVPTRILLLPRGRVTFLWDSGKRLSALCDDQAFAQVVAEFERRGTDLVIDFEHQSMKDGPNPAAGWIKRLAADAEGLWAQVEWTPPAAELLRNKQYRYLSPVFWTNKADGRVVKLGPIALTNTPATVGARPIVSNRNDPSDEEEKDMKQVIAKLCALLGLKPEATEQEMLAGMGAVEAALKVAATVREKLALKPEDDVAAAASSWQPRAKEVLPKRLLDVLGLAAGATVSDAEAAIAAMKPAAEQFQAVRTELNEVKAKLLARETEELVASALKAGKVTPAQKEWAAAYAARDPEGFKTFLAKAPVIVKPGYMGIKTDPAGKGGIDPVQASINAQLGVSDEAFLKHNPVSQEG